jgi:hypothetical protein
MAISSRPVPQLAVLSWCPGGCVELRAERGWATCVDGGEPIDCNNYLLEGWAYPAQRVKHVTMLLREVLPLPDRLVVKDAVAESTDLREPCRQGMACSYSAREVRKCWPE